jgi:FAD/FMN-containing dehydrogenase
MLETTAVTSLREHFRGELITAADGERFDRARAVFNGMYDRRPALIARVSGVADVIAALQFARQKGLVVAVRGGGHSVAGYSTCEGGLVIDLGAMKGIRVDPVTRTARAQGGVNWGEFDRETQVFGLATTGGRVTSTGLAGLTLGSGSGWLDRVHGLTCDNLISADLVTADGRLLTASARQNQELFWGLRGGGGNFGVVTEFEYQLHPVGPLVLGGLVLHPLDKAVEVARFYRDFIASAPPELSGGLALISAPPAPFVPPELQGRPVLAVIVAWFGAIDRGEQLLAELRAFASPPVDVVQPMPYLALQSMLDAGNPSGRRNYWRSDNLTGLPDAAIEALVARAACVTSPFTQLIIVPLGGAVARVAEDAMAIGSRSAPWQYHCYACWTEGDDASHIAWVRGTEQALRGHAEAGISVNFVSEAGADRVRASFGAAKYERLVALKNELDPGNVFRLNQNIVPTVSRA